jgi:Flp pilus assembly protein TadB
MNDQRLDSERVIVQAPMSFIGSAKRIWKITGVGAPWNVLLGILAVLLITFAWVVVLLWYVFAVFLFGWIILLPYRLIRRSSRNRKRSELQHRETLEAIQNLREQESPDGSL